MSNNSVAKNPFQFYSRLHLTESTGLRAATLVELLNHLRDVPGSSIYHHTHRMLQQHERLSPEPPNDFAYWIIDALGEHELSEMVASIDIIQFETIRQLRERMIIVIEKYIAENPSAKVKCANPNKQFCFLKSISFVIPLPHVANDLKQFIEVLSNITIDSLYYHFFEARLRLENKNNDFSSWIEHGLGNKILADEIPIHPCGTGLFGPLEFLSE